MTNSDNFDSIFRDWFCEIIEESKNDGECVSIGTIKIKDSKWISISELQDRIIDKFESILIFSLFPDEEAYVIRNTKIDDVQKVYDSKKYTKLISKSVIESFESCKDLFRNKYKMELNDIILTMKKFKKMRVLDLKSLGEIEMNTLQIMFLIVTDCFPDREYDIPDKKLEFYK